MDDLIYEKGGKKYYSFLSVAKLSAVDVQELREISKVGFKDQRIIDSSNMIKYKQVEIMNIYEMDKEEGKEELMKLPGVGSKVVDCVLLFAFRKGSAFPVDTWVKKIMEYFYLKEETALSKIGKAGEEYFGELAGYAQKYLFYYAREENIWK